MRKKSAVFLILLFSSFAVFAHRLNEYLQATTISLSAKTISLEIRLTPGVATAPSLLNAIDLNGDKQISKSEELAYLKVLDHDLFFTLDGTKKEPELLSYSFPTIAGMEKGTGDIVVRYQLKIGKQLTVHSLQLLNKHYSAFGIYLVNCLLPADTSVKVTDQIRNADQSAYLLKFSVDKSQLIPANSRQSLEGSSDRAITKHLFYTWRKTYPHRLRPFIIPLCIGIGRNRALGPYKGCNRIHSCTFCYAHTRNLRLCPLTGIYC